MGAMFVALLVFAYLLGSLPIGLIVGKAVRGIDVREHGSGNIGATNVWRTLGPVWGSLVFALDVGKGLAPVLLAQRNAAHIAWLPVAAGLAAILGHNFSVFLKFKGGKGVATTLGVAFGLSWVAGLVGFGVWLVVLGADALHFGLFAGRHPDRRVLHLVAQRQAPGPTASSPCWRRCSCSSSTGRTWRGSGRARSRRWSAKEGRQPRKP